MLELLSFIPTAFASGGVEAATIATTSTLSVKGIISIIGLVLLFTILITEKVDKTVISILIAGLLIFLQVFVGIDSTMSSQHVAAGFIYHNLDIFGFIIGMMILTGLVKDTGIFDFFAISIAKKVNGNPKKLFFIFAYMAFFMTVFISNIPTIIILAPIIILITTRLDLPSLPYIIGIITFANLGGAVTPISDPTTYYQATTLGLSFFDVISNTGLIMFTVTISSSIYLYLVFRKDFMMKPELSAISKLDPTESLGPTRKIVLSLSLLFTVIFFVVTKEFIYNETGIKFDNGSITLFGAFLAILLLKNDVSNVLKTKVDYATLFFFAGLFIVVGALEYNGVIILLADKLVEITGGSDGLLLLMLTMGSAMLSVFIDNVPYNIAMVSTLESFRDSGIVVGASWTALAWGLNSCTSIGGAGSPIGAACNVIALGAAEKSGVIIRFIKFLMIGVPLVLINSSIAYAILYFRYLF